MRPIRAISSILLMLAISFDLVAQTPARQTEALQKYMPYVGAPVSEIRLFDMHEWELVGEDKVVVWARLNAPYLITVALPCNDLQYTPSISLTSNSHRVLQKFDKLHTRQNVCDLLSIQPIDYKAMQRDNSAKKADAGKQPSPAS